MTTLRDWQRKGLAHYKANARAGCRISYVAPTGTGKGTFALAIRAFDPDGTVIVTPSDRIIEGFCERLGITCADAEDHGIFTPVAFRNRLVDGREPPRVVIFDESHHAIAMSWQDLEALTRGARLIGMTATPYRGTLAEGRELDEFWGQHVVLCTEPEAVAAGWMSVPDVEVVPLLDDDVVKLTSTGEMVESQADRLYTDWERVRELRDVCLRERAYGPTVVVVPGSRARDALCEDPAFVGISAKTSGRQRDEALEATKRHAILVTVGVGIEGADWPWMQVLVDARPINSPVLWRQMLGRVMRSGAPRRYVCTNRNLERHAWLLGDVWPANKHVATQQEAFDGPSKRTGWRSLGFENMTKARPVKLRLIDGGYLTAWTVSRKASDGVGVEQTVVVIPPGSRTPFTCRRTNPQSGMYGKWQRAEFPSDGLVGWQSVSLTTPSKKAANWFTRDAARIGIDPMQEIDGKQFTVFAALLTGRR